MSSPRLDRGQLFLGAGATVRAYSTASLTLLWSTAVPPLKTLGDVTVALSDSAVLSTGTRNIDFWNALKRLGARDGWAFLRTAFRTKKLDTYRSWFAEQSVIALDRRTGHVLWRQSLGVGLQVPRNTSGTPVVIGHVVVVSSPVSRSIWAFDLGTGRRLWRRRLEAQHKGASTIFNDGVLLGDKSGLMSLLDTSDGHVIGRCRAGDAFSVLSPVVIGQTTIVATHDGWVHAIPTRRLQANLTDTIPKSCFRRTKLDH
jgi:outer membrane protein assembly factor BamB